MFPHNPNVAFGPERYLERRRGALGAALAAAGLPDDGADYWRVEGTDGTVWLWRQGDAAPLARLEG